MSAGPVPPRVDAGVKAGLLELVDHAVGHGWPVRRAAAALGLDHARCHHWAARRDAGRLDDLPPGGNPLHGTLDWEREAIVGLFDAWAEVDRSHRKLAHRGSRLDVVHVSESTVRRVLAAEGVVLQGNPPREPVPRTPWPQWLEWKPNRVWAYDFTHWSRARRTDGGCSSRLLVSESLRNVLDRNNKILGGFVKFDCLGFARPLEDPAGQVDSAATLVGCAGCDGLGPGPGQADVSSGAQVHGGDAFDGESADAFPTKEGLVPVAQTARLTPQ